MNNQDYYPEFPVYESPTARYLVVPADDAYDSPVPYPALVLDADTLAKVAGPFGTTGDAMDEAAKLVAQDAEAELAREHGQYISDVRRDAAGF